MSDDLTLKFILEEEQKTPVNTGSSSSLKGSGEAPPIQNDRRGGVVSGDTELLPEPGDREKKSDLPSLPPEAPDYLPPRWVRRQNSSHEYDPDASNSEISPDNIGSSPVLPELPKSLQDVKDAWRDDLKQIADEIPELLGDIFKDVREEVEKLAGSGSGGDEGGGGDLFGGGLSPPSEPPPVNENNPDDEEKKNSPFGDAIRSALPTVGGVVGGFLGGPAGAAAGTAIGAGLAQLGDMSLLAAGALGTVVEGLEKLNDIAREVSESLVNVSPDVTEASIERDIRKLEIAFGRSERIGPELAENYRANTELDAAWEEIKTTLLDKFLPLLTGIADFAKQVLTIINFVLEIIPIEEIIKLLSFLVHLTGIPTIIKWLASLVGDNEEERQKAMDKQLEAVFDWLDPKNFTMVNDSQRQLQGALDMGVGGPF